MHNDIMAAGSKDRPPRLAIRRYAQVLVPAKKETKTDPPVPKHTVQETYENTLPENHAYIDAEAEAIHMILSGIGDAIYSTVDACKTAQEMWTTIERMQQGESLNKQDVKNNIF
nr:RNA-directed DNA polymerase, eukaryota [Tanacetum cinerariifolium]